MFDRVRLLERIERAFDDDPVCAACGAHTEIVEEDGAIVIRCTSASRASGVIARLGAVVLPHLRHRLVEPEELHAA